MVWPISDESKRIITTALAPMAVALRTSRSTAWRRVSSSSWVYSWISPPTMERRLATMLPPRPRERTTTPKTWPSVLARRVPGMFSVVVTSMAGGPPLALVILYGDGETGEQAGQNWGFDRL